VDDLDDAIPFLRNLIKVRANIKCNKLMMRRRIPGGVLPLHHMPYWHGIYAYASANCINEAVRNGLDLVNASSKLLAFCFRLIM